MGKIYLRPKVSEGPTRRKNRAVDEGTPEAGRSQPRGGKVADLAGRFAHDTRASERR